MADEKIRKLAEAISRICAAETAQQLKTVLQSSVEDFGFASFNLSFQKKTKQQFMSSPTLTSWSSKDLETYLDDRWAERDPLLDYAATQYAPIAWRADDWLAKNEHAEYGDYVRSVGIISGITAPLDSRENNISAITVLSVTDTPITDDDVYAIQILGRVSIVRAAVLGMPDSDILGVSNDFPALSARQTEILEWAALGKSNGDIAVIIGQSKRSVDYHIAEILKKLGTSTKAHAIAMYSVHRSKLHGR